MLLSSTRLLVSLALAAVAVLAAPVAARADDDREDDVRVTRACSAGSTIQLRLRDRDDDELRVDVTVRARSRNASWSVVLVHERRLVWRARVRTGGSSGSFSRRITVPDWPGNDTIVVRAIGPRGEICRATATLRED